MCIRVSFTVLGVSDSAQNNGFERSFKRRKLDMVINLRSKPRRTPKAREEIMLVGSNWREMLQKPVYGRQFAGQCLT